jgi:hypothetical protein
VGGSCLAAVAGIACLTIARDSLDSAAANQSNSVVSCIGDYDITIPRNRNCIWTAKSSLIRWPTVASETFGPCSRDHTS